jgi:alpha-glucosidase
MTVPQLINLGLSGFSFAGADVGGFAGSPPADLLTKWLEVAAFQPIDRDHSAKGTRMHEPWVDGADHEAMRRRYIEERYRLLPYIYTVAEETSRNGMPMMRPLFMEFPHAVVDGSPMDPGGAEFLLGPDLLIAPNPSPEEVAPYELHLPPGNWYDYWTGQRVGFAAKTQARDAEVRDDLLQAQQIMLKPTLGTVPVYVRGGAIIPRQELVQSTDETPPGPLTLRVYLPTTGERCEGSVYGDDGHSLDYRKGDFYRSNITCAIAADGSVTVNIGPREGSYQPRWKRLRIEVVGSNHYFKEAMVDDKKMPITMDHSEPGVEFEYRSIATKVLVR